MLFEKIQKSANLLNSRLFYFCASAYIVVSYHVLALGNGVNMFFLPEDHYFESVGAFSFFVASLLFFFGFWALRSFGTFDRCIIVKKIVLLGLAVVFFFGAGEEISWGQRVFNIQTPEVLHEINAQDEITVHNIRLGAWEIPFETLFDLFWSFLAFLTPLTALYKPAGDLARRFLPVSQWAISLLFLLNYLWAKFAKLYYVGNYSFKMPFAQAVQEIKESNYALLFAFFALSSVALFPELTKKMQDVSNAHDNNP